MWRRDPRCYWCGRPTVIHEEVCGKKIPANAATIDHLWSRLDPRRKPGKPGPKVLACFKCNHRRGAAEDLALPLEVRQHRSVLGSMPRSRNWRGRMTMELVLA